MKYGVILADCPWQYRNTGGLGHAERHYATMATEEIAALPVEELAAHDAVLILWATWPQIPEALKVIGAWGFEYKAGFPWVKIVGEPCPNFFGETIMRPRFGNGWWVRGASEPVLIATRGKPRLPSQPWVGLLCDRMEHSRKPADLYEYAESLERPRLELFARRKREKWHAWGNQVDSDIVLTSRHESESGGADDGTQRQRPDRLSL